MVRFMKKISKKSGLPPGTLVHVGEKRTEQARIRVLDYDEGRIEERDMAGTDECFLYKDKQTVSWINVDGLHQVDLIENIGKCFDLHPLILEDILNTTQRPKLQDLEDYICLILKMITYDETINQLHIEQVTLILGSNFVISFQETEGDVFDLVRDRLRKGKGKIRKMGADYLAYALLDAIVDNYFIVLEKIGEEIESLEDELLEKPDPETVSGIHNLKRELINLVYSVPFIKVMSLKLRVIPKKTSFIPQWIY